MRFIACSTTLLLAARWSPSASAWPGPSRCAGFGMRLYPDGDPRGRELLRRLDDVAMEPQRRAVVDAVITLASGRELAPPNVDFGLGALAFGAQMIPGAGQAITVVGRMAGWLAHALEEYESRTVFRARATYVGVRPGSGPEGPALRPA